MIGREGEGDAMMAEQRRDLEDKYLYAILIYMNYMMLGICIVIVRYLYSICMVFGT